MSDNARDLAIGFAILVAFSVFAGIIDGPPAVNAALYVIVLGLQISIGVANEARRPPPKVRWARKLGAGLRTMFVTDATPTPPAPPPRLRPVPTPPPPPRGKNHTRPATSGPDPSRCRAGSDDVR
jgi:hypothetical protein